MYGIKFKGKGHHYGGKIEFNIAVRDLKDVGRKSNFALGGFGRDVVRFAGKLFVEIGFDLRKCMPILTDNLSQNCQHVSCIVFITP